MSKLETWYVRIRDDRNQSWSYRQNYKSEYQKAQEEFENRYYNVINKIVDAGGLIEPSKYFSVNTNLKIKATADVALQKIKNIPGIESIKGPSN